MTLPSQNDEDHSNGNSQFKNSLRMVSPYLNVGIVWAASVAIFTFIGYKLDQKWELYPVLTIIGAIWGVAGGFYHFIKTVLVFQNREKSESRK